MLPATPRNVPSRFLRTFPAVTSLKDKYPPRPIMTYPTKHTRMVSVMTPAAGPSPHGRIDRVTGRTAGCAPNAKTAKGSTDIAPPKFTHATGTRLPPFPSATSVGVVVPVTPADPAAARVEDQFMYGPGYMVAPVLEPNATELTAATAATATGSGSTGGNSFSRAVYFPAGASYKDYFTGRAYAGGTNATVPITSLQTFPFFEVVRTN